MAMIISPRQLQAEEYAQCLLNPRWLLRNETCQTTVSDGSIGGGTLCGRLWRHCLSCCWRQASSRHIQRRAVLGVRRAHTVGPCGRFFLSGRLLDCLPCRSRARGAVGPIGRRQSAGNAAPVEESNWREEYRGQRLRGVRRLDRGRRLLWQGALRSRLAVERLMEAKPARLHAVGPQQKRFERAAGRSG